MASTKYGEYVKRLSFVDEGPGSFRQGTRLTADDLGMDVNLAYGTYWTAGRIGKDAQGAHVHDFDQMMLWLGTDTSDVGDLGAEVELGLGDEPEKHMITTSTAVGIPRGFPHFPANVARLDRRFILLEVSLARDCHATKLAAPEGSFESAPVAGFGAKHRGRVSHLSFTRKGAWHYGPKNPDDSGGALAFVRGQDMGFDFLMMCESLRKAPYRFGPDPDKPHVHPKPEILLFVGADADDLSQLGGEVEISLGEEMERHIISAPAAVVVPGGLWHLPLVVTKLSRPFFLIDVRPLGTEAPRPS